MKCHQCSAPFDRPDQPFCGHCGTKTPEKAALALVTCDNCQAALSPHLRFCTSCGHKVKKQEKLCKCGTLLEENVRFCGNCGEPAVSPDTAVAAPPLSGSWQGTPNRSWTQAVQDPGGQARGTLPPGGQTDAGGQAEDEDSPGEDPAATDIHRDGEDRELTGAKDGSAIEGTREANTGMMASASATSPVSIESVLKSNTSSDVTEDKFYDTEQDIHNPIASQVYTEAGNNAQGALDSDDSEEETSVKTVVDQQVKEHEIGAESGSDAMQIRAPLAQQEFMVRMPLIGPGQVLRMPQAVAGQMVKMQSAIAGQTGQMVRMQSAVAGQTGQVVGMQSGVAGQMVGMQSTVAGQMVGMQSTMAGQAGQMVGMQSAMAGQAGQMVRMQSGVAGQMVGMQSTVAGQAGQMVGMQSAMAGQAGQMVGMQSGGAGQVVEMQSAVAGQAGQMVGMQSGGAGQVVEMQSAMAEQTAQMVGMQSTGAEQTDVMQSTSAVIRVYQEDTGKEVRSYVSHVQVTNTKQMFNQSNMATSENREQVPSATPVLGSLPKSPDTVTKPNSTNKGQPPRSRQRRARRRGNAKREKQTTTVVFHLVLSKQFEDNFGQIFLDLYPSDVPSCNLTYQRMENNSGCLYRGETEVLVPPNNFLKIQYRYCLDETHYKGKKRDPKTAKFVESTWRSINFQQAWKNTAGECHVHDILQFPTVKTRSAWGPLFNLFKSKPTQVLNVPEAISLLFPSPQGILQTIENSDDDTCDSEPIEDVVEEMAAIRRRLQAHCTEEDLRKCILQYIVGPFSGLLEERSQTGLRLVVPALFLLRLVETQTLNPHSDNLNWIFRNLLVKPDLLGNFSDLKNIRFHFQRTGDSLLGKQIIPVIRRLVWQDADPSWLLAVPLLHFLGNEVTPFEDLEPSADHRTARWWGVEQLSNCVNGFKFTTNRLPWKYSELQVYDTLQEVFPLDPLMLRSFLAVLNFPSLVQVLSQRPVPVPLTLAALFYHLNTESSKDSTIIQKISDILLAAKDVISAKMQTLENVSQRTVDDACCTAMIGNDLLEEMNRSMSRDYNAFSAMVSLQLQFLDMYAYAESLLKEQPEFSEELKAVIDTSFAAVRIWAQLSGMHVQQKVKILQQSLLQSLEVRSGLLRNEVQNDVLGVLASHLEQLPATDRIETCCKILENPDQLSQPIVTKFGQILDTALAEDHTVRVWEQRNIDPMYNMFCNSFKSMVMESQDLRGFVFTWKPLAAFLRNSVNSDTGHYMQHTMSQYLETIHTFVQTLAHSLVDASITVEDVEWLKGHDENFCDVMSAIVGDGTQARTALELRVKEVVAFRDAVDNVRSLFTFCRQFIQTDDCEEMVKMFEERNQTIDHLSVGPLCMDTAVVGEVLPEDYSPLPRVPGTSERFMPFLPSLCRCFHSELFCYLLRRLAGQRGDAPDAGFWDVLVAVWSETSREWQAVCQAVCSGEINRAEAYQLFSIIEQGEGWSARCYGEILKMSVDASDSSWVDERVKQVECLITMEPRKQAARSLQNFKNQYGFAGNMDDISSFLEEDQGLTLGSLQPALVGTSEALCEISAENIAHLRQFGQPGCVAFVEWIRDKMGNDLQSEIKVFVNLALNYVGDNPQDMDKVRNFQAVIMGYAPLIFPIASDSKSFLEVCCDVFRNIQHDPDLPTKLESTVQRHGWFIEIYEFHGSVEKNALTQVISITGKGILRMGRSLQSNMSSSDLSVDDVVCMEVPEDREGPGGLQLRRYTYPELLDLQGRLMLVVGHAEQGCDSVDQFIAIMEGIVRLSQTYLQLCHDGCVLFHNWAVKFFCDPEKPVCCIVEFFQSDEQSKQQFKGWREGTSLGDYIAEVANYLDHCHERWLRYVDRKRGDYEELNIYTMDQLVFLQEQLVLLDTPDCSPLVFPLLSLLRDDCTVANVLDAIKAASEHETDIDMTNQKGAEDDNEVTAAKNYLKYMADNGFSTKLAAKAYEHTTDLNEGLMWCVDHAMDMFEQEEEEMDDREGGVQTLITRRGTVATALKQLEGLDGSMTRSTVGERLGAVWDKFLQTVKFSGKDCLSLHDLGLLLRFMAKQDDVILNRQLPAYLNPGQPHLLLSPAREVLNTVTGLYMMTESAPLPKPDEVLICRPDTTFEQVSMFLRRAFSKGALDKGKIHCLAFADCLDYGISEKLERMMNEYVNRTDIKYKLVVICTAENEFNAHMTAALEKYLRQPNVAMHSDKIRSYICSKLAVPADTPEQQSAACLDPEKLCVRVVQSSRAGMGKSLYKKRLANRLHSLHEGAGVDHPLVVTIPLNRKILDSENVASILLHHTLPLGMHRARLIHLDISYEVQEGVDLLLYNLLVLGCITDVHGKVWRRSSSDLYLIEAMPLLEHTETQEHSRQLIHPIFEILPRLHCWSPCESLLFLTEKNTKEKGEFDLLFDPEEFRSEVFQRPFLYLNHLDEKKKKRPTPLPVGSGPVTEDQRLCLETLIRHCGLRQPSWSELFHFVSFLNKQLLDFQHSPFTSDVVAQDLPGFANFVLRFLIHMAKDFATRSLVVAEEVVPALMDNQENDAFDLANFQMSRTWESSPHPYIFFNPDGESMTFLGFTVDPETCNLVNPSTQEVMEEKIMKPLLYEQLTHVIYKVPLNDEFDSLERHEKLERLYRVMGVPEEDMFTVEEGNRTIVDPDDTYELTTDNAKKILAIYMRFRCNIPVIIMGETGCGKTRLVKFMCALQTPKNTDIDTMVLLKVHGGTTSQLIQEKVEHAEKVAKETRERFPNRPVYTVLFFDEANTTEAVGAIKEVMCDGAMNGKPIQLHENLKMVAACNPYRKHSEETIKRLEKAGLGYHVTAAKTRDKLGRLPMRQLVYRVVPLPQSMLPLVWDFGQLSEQVELMYIQQMVRRCVRQGLLGHLTPELTERYCSVLIASQNFMRNLSDECSFVSLRDVERTLTVTNWFLHQRLLLTCLKEALVKDQMIPEEMDEVTICIVLALGVCYRAGLCSKNEYDKTISPIFNKSEGDVVTEVMTPQRFSHIIESCQDLMLQNVDVGEKIARNQALKENFFMMVVCVELGIPLFLVGKPGSSKSLAKAIVDNAMRGSRAYSALFKTFKEIQMLSFQCSHLSTAEGIVSTFRQCALIQHGKDRAKFSAVAVLDEIGLAEDSPKMPLKALHPLLEEGCEVEVMEDMTAEDGTTERCKKKVMIKVAFIGISNWALDPAKMNRGIPVQRDAPDEEELVQTARGICSSGEEGVLDHVESLLTKLASAYLSIFNEARIQREFFGLRDFYSLVKMIHAIATDKNNKLSRSEFRNVIERNFGGLETFNPVETFEKTLNLSDIEWGPEDKFTDYRSLLLSALQEDQLPGRQSRYLLLLSENYGGLRILMDNVLQGRDVVPIFGSSFPKDQEVTQIYRNVNLIKCCMETGKTVILLNLENLYESLYDALNQYYSVLAGVRYVDLGLGSNRVKSKVDTRFRMVVVAEKQTVYQRFPIPLINRLEKQFLTHNNLLNEQQRKLASKLIDWIKAIVDIGDAQKGLDVCEMFVGFHADTVASIVVTACENHAGGQVPTSEDEEVMAECRAALLWCATPDAIIRISDASLSDMYFTRQQHDDLTQYLQEQLRMADGKNFLAQVTTHSRMLTSKNKKELEDSLPDTKFTLKLLQSFQTEQQYLTQLSHFLGDSPDETCKHRVLIIQCERGNLQQEWLQNAQFRLQEKWVSCAQPNQHAVFVVQLPRVTSTPFSGFVGGKWHCAHVDDLRQFQFKAPTVPELQSRSPAQLMSPAGHQPLSSLSMSHNNEWYSSSSTSQLHEDLLRHLLISCVQGAVARLRDRYTMLTQRAMHRIAVLIQFLEREDDPRFFKGVLRMMTAALEEKEATLPDPQNWLAEDAARPEWIKKAGTFRRAWMQSLERHIVPMLAGVVAYLDSDHNLDLLNEQGWVPEVWLKILGDPSICQLPYSDLQAPSGSVRNEFICHSSFLADCVTPCTTPFFWIILEMVEKALLKAPSSASVQDDGDGDAVYTNLESSAILGHISDTTRTPQDAKDFLLRYMSDLLHTRFTLTPELHKLLLTGLQCAMHQIVGEEEVTFHLGRDLMQVHHVLDRSQGRLQAILDMVACQPSLLQNPQITDPGVDMPKDEMVLDILMLVQLVESLTPKPAQLISDEKCRDWIDHFNHTAPIILRVLADVHSSWALDDERANHPPLRYGLRCQELLTDITCMWTRLFSVKLFIDYMSPLVADVDKFQIDSSTVNYNLLWTILGKQANLKAKTGLLNIDKFLQVTEAKMVLKFLGTNCDQCGALLRSCSVKLPCHRLCDECYTREVQPSGKCPQCHKDLPDNFDIEHSRAQERKAEEKLWLFLKQTSGFLMAVVSQLSFAGQEPPEPDAVKHIFGYIMPQGDSGSVGQVRLGKMERTPVLKSFILHLLIQYREAEVTEYIETFLQEAEQRIQQHVPLQQEMKATLTELSLLVIYCIENQEREKEATDEGRANTPGQAGFERQCQYVLSLVSTPWKVLDSSALKLPTLLRLGKLRYALTACAKIIHALYLQEGQERPLDDLLQELFIGAGTLCGFGSTNWPLKYFIKQICREYGIQAYTKLLEKVKDIRCLKWVQVDSIPKEVGVPDRCLVCGEDYVKIRSAVKLALLSQRELLADTLTTMTCSSELTAYCLLLALHQEAMAITHLGSQSMEKTTENVTELLKLCTALSVNEEFAVGLVRGAMGGEGLLACRQDDQRMGGKSLMCVLTHFWLALRAQTHEHDTLAPFISLLNEPELMQNSYLPTMPQDSVKEVVQALTAVDGRVPLVWECPKGHRYLIGNLGSDSSVCGQPVMDARCNECGEDIGAKVKYQASVGNKQVTLEDRTQCGHVLGPAEERSLEAVSDRGLPVASVALLRFLTHATLYLSASQPEKRNQVCLLVKPLMNEEGVAAFFWRHLIKDLRILEEVLGRCCDDVYIILHHLCHLLALRQADTSSSRLESKEEREAWEKAFSSTFIQPLVMESDTLVKSGNSVIVSDFQRGESELLNLVFEVGEDSMAGEKLQDSPAPWKYRARITVDHFFRQFQLHVQGSHSAPDVLPVLKLFYEESHHLQALHYVPRILTLQRRVMQQLRYQLNRVDVSKMSIQEIINNKDCHDLEELMDVFSKAWNIVKTFLTGYSCAKIDGDKARLIDLSRPVVRPAALAVSLDSPVGLLLPDTEGPGRCAYLMLHYLLVQHNNFLERYCAIPMAKQRYEQVPEVRVSAITRRHLVSYSPQADLLPLVLAHCDYSLHLGHGSNQTLTYDFHEFELQMRNTLLLSKSRVQRGQHGAMEIETMSYCADTTFSRQLGRLRDKVGQVPLSLRVRRQIIDELGDSLPDVSQSLDNLNTAIAYLLSLKVKDDQLICSFMDETLQMRDTIHSRKAQQECCVKHVQSLWLLLCQQRAGVMATHNQEAFDEQGEHLRDELDEEQERALGACLKRMLPEKVEHLLSQMFECIMLHLLHTYDQDSVDPSTYDLACVIFENLEYSTYSVQAEDSFQGLQKEDLDYFPRAILASQALAVWKFTHRHLLTRKQQAAGTGLVH